ncbi:DUF998 domain-containing protein [Hyphomicrobium sp.]|uniref:DUF998 domain-containing protein n=1 Tax=Hyphomicrobium sp. TaxID=82 RepID=UPI002D778FEC|nr:DUF998 domain-containing protein [Hyphomicrobium sp.]HET6389369.1 DUF998 domain-containing protein [Hyphomicrobium sp.]
MTTDLTIDRLLLAGVVAALLFFVIPTIAIFLRPGFDIERHAISMLSLGEGGWVMKAVFMVSGLLTFLCALGLYRVLAHTWPGFTAAILVGLFAAGLVLAGLFDAPAGLGFPPGTPQDQEPVMTPGAVVHSIAFMIAFGGLIAACFAFAMHFFLAQQWLLGSISAAAGIALPALIALGVSLTVAPGIAFYWASMLGWAWLAAVVLTLPPAA